MDRKSVPTTFTLSPFSRGIFRWVVRLNMASYRLIHLIFRSKVSPLRCASPKTMRREGSHHNTSNERESSSWPQDKKVASKLLEPKCTASFSLISSNQFFPEAKPITHFT